MSKKYVLGIDGGTGGMRVGLYDLDGIEVAYHEIGRKPHV